MSVTTEPRSAAVLRKQAEGSDGTFWLATLTVGLLAAAVFLRVWKLSSLPGVNGDEAWSGVQALRWLQGQPVAWRTPTGNPVNIFFMVPLVTLHAVFAPSFALLRSVAVVSGLLALVANYWLCNRAFDRRTAVISTVLLAVLPINVAYSRFAWDASQSLLATVLVLYLPLLWLRRLPQAGVVPAAAFAALVAAVIVHPTSVFAAPLVVVPILYGYRDRLLAGLRTTKTPARPTSLVLLAIVSLTIVYGAWHLLAVSVTRLHGPAELVPFCENYLRLLCGATVFEYISGANLASGSLAALAWLPFVCKLAFGGVVVVAGLGVVRRLANEAAAVDVSLLIGWGTMLLGFALVAGAEAIVPHLERYGICLVAPGALVISRGLAWWVEPERPHARLAAWSLAIAGWFFPVAFYLGYFELIERSGGLSHRAFRTATVEPKQAAFRRIVALSDRTRPIEIVTSEWWLYWPLEYLALAEPNVRVRGLSADLDPEARQPSTAAVQTWYVEFAGRPGELAVLQEKRDDGKNLEQEVIDDYAKKPLISLLREVPKDFAE